MKAERLRDAIWKIDDKFIKEAETYVPKKRSGNTIWIITSASAAVIALCTCVHYHNAVNQALNPEIDNTVVITTTVSETEAYETEVVKTEKPLLISEPVSENTEVTETKTVSESSVPDVATVPEKTEAPSGNGGSSGEKTVVTQKPQDVTKAPATETAEVTSEVQTDEPVTEPPVTEELPSAVTDPDYVPQLQFMEINSAIETIQKNDVSVYSGENREAFCEVHDRLLTDGKFFVQTAEKPIDTEKDSTVNILTRTEKNDICIEYNLYYKNNVFIIQFCYADKETAGISSDLSDYLSRRLNVKTDSYLSAKNQPFLIELDEESYMKKIYSALDDYHYMRISTGAGEKDITEFLEAFSFETTEIQDLSKNNMG